MNDVLRTQDAKVFFDIAEMSLVDRLYHPYPVDGMTSNRIEKKENKEVTKYLSFLQQVLHAIRIGHLVMETIVTNTVAKDGA